MKANAAYLDIGRRIKHIRAHRAMTQAALGKAIGFHSQTAMHLLECGKTRLRVAELLRIASVLRVSPSVLLGSVEEGNKRASDTAPSKIVNSDALPVSQCRFFIPQTAPSGT